MPKTSKRIKKTGVFRTPEELKDCFIATRVIIHSHIYEKVEGYEQLIATLLGVMMLEYHEFRQIGIMPIDFELIENAEVTRKNILSILEHVKDEIELSQKLKGESTQDEGKSDRGE